MSQRYQAAILSASFNGLKAPDAPTIGTATAGAGSASVAFTAPANVGGGAITGYTVISSPGSIIGTGASSPVTVSGLTNGTAYTFTVVATNAYGTGPASAASNSVTPAVNYIEDVFSTYLYTGTGANLTITNGIDLSGKGGLVWIKQRVSSNHLLMTTDGGPTNRLRSNGTPSYVTSTAGKDFASFNSNGFSLGVNEQSDINTSAQNAVSWSFRKQPKFFDVVTWTGNGANRTIAHNLGSVPGCIIIGATTALGTNWAVYHRSLANTEYLQLNLTGAKQTDSTYWNSTTATSSVFSLGTNAEVNYNTGTYIAYLFAHDAGGFGLSGTENVISCGSWTNNGSGNASVTLGYEPQWILWKRSDSTSDWYIFDTMRGWTGDPNNSSAGLRPNLANAENSLSGYAINSTGFSVAGVASASYIYIAIRRGPMAVPTVGTTAFSPIAYTGNSTSNTTVQNLTTNFAGDATLIVPRNNPQNPFFADKLRGNVLALYTSLTFAQENFSTARPGQSIGFNNTQTVLTGQFTAQGTYNYSGDTIVSYNLQRAPSVFDEVILNSSTTTYNHNLTVSPELILVKCTDAAGANWVVYSKSLSSPTTQYLVFNGVNATQTHGAGAWAVSSTQFSVDPGLWANGSAGVSYLFATAAGVSKVGSYTGTGALITVDCGFTTGARFVLIKRTDSTGDWYVWDSARGITSGNDPFSNTNTSNVETTGTNYVDTTGVGFQVTAAASTTVNVSSGTYIFLAIA